MAPYLLGCLLAVAPPAVAERSDSRAAEDKRHMDLKSEAGFQELLRLVEKNQIAHLLQSGMLVSDLERKILARERFCFFSNGRTVVYLYPTPSNSDDVLMVQYGKTDGEARLAKWKIWKNSRHVFFDK